MRVIKLETNDVRAVFTTDWHVSDQPPGSRTAGYSEEILAKVHFVINLANSIKAVSWCGGDVYHNKNAKNAVANSYRQQTRLEQELRRALLNTVFGTHGNHDLWQDRVDSIPNQPIGSLIASGAYTDVSNESVIFESNDGLVRVQLDALPYQNDDLEALALALNASPRAENVNYRVLLFHQYGNPGDSPTMHDKPIIGFNRMAESDYDLVLWGHDHSRTQTVTVGNTTHVRLGSLSRASLAEDQVDRPVAAAVFTFTADRIKFKEMAVPTKPLEVAFVAGDKAVDKVADSKEVTNFFAAMDSTVSDVVSSDTREILYSLCPEGEREIADEAVQRCGL